MKTDVQQCKKWMQKERQHSSESAPRSKGDKTASDKRHKSLESKGSGDKNRDNSFKRSKAAADMPVQLKKPAPMKKVLESIPERMPQQMPDRMPQ